MNVLPFADSENLDHWVPKWAITKIKEIITPIKVGEYAFSIFKVVEHVVNIQWMLNAWHGTTLSACEFAAFVA